MKKILYLGDDALDRAAIYLAGILEWAGLPYDHIDSTESLDDSMPLDYSLYIFSDYPRERISDAQLAKIVDAVQLGSGLLMLGGWESFHGQLGQYQHSPLVELLPVMMLDEDDRINFPQSALVRPVAEHSILAGLPWENPPAIGGLNCFIPKEGTELLLVADQLDIECQQNDEEMTAYNFDVGAVHPLLVTGTHGKGRVVAFACDVAPHWVGGFVDWGRERISQQVGDGEIEVGKDYATFFKQLVLWTGDGA